MSTPGDIARELVATIDANRAPKPGVYKKLPAGDYHNVWKAVSNSLLQQMKKSPAHMRYAMDHEVEPTPAMLIGSAVHCAVLEPDIFPALYFACEGDRRTKAVKEAIAALEAENPGAIILSADDHARCLAIRDAVYANATARTLLTGAGDVELSFAWQHEVLSMGGGSLVLCKGRADRVSWEIAGGTIVDLKTTTDARKGPFERKIFQMGYYNQGALYVDGVRANRLAIKHYSVIAIEKDPPYGVAVYRMKDEVLEAGRIENGDLIAHAAKCMLSGVWPCYSNDITDISLPDWAWRTIEEGTA